MRNKKWMKLSTLLISLVLVLSACAKTEPPSSTSNSGGTKGKTKITFWTPFSGGDGEFMTAMIDKFNQENPNIQVEQLGNTSEDYYTKLQTSLASDQAPDLAVMHSSRLPQFVPAGFVTPLDDLASKTGVNWEDFNSNILDSTVFEGKHYSLPLDTHVLAMYYNKKYLQQADVLKDDKPVIDKSPEGFTKFLTQIKGAVPGDVAPLAQPNVRIDSYWMFWGLYNQIKDGGGSFYDASGKAALNNPAALQALNYVDSLYTSKLIPPNIDDAMKLFQSQKAATIITGVWATGAFENTKDLDFGVVPMPQLYDQPATWGDSHTLVLPKHSKEDSDKQQAALTFANWLVQHGEMWAKAGHIPAVSKVLDSEEFKALKYRSDYAVSADFVKYFPRNAKQGEVNDNVIKEFEKMMLGKQDPQTTLQHANEVIDKTLSK